MSARVRTQSGRLQGEVLRGAGSDVHVYRGVPYAEPPLGELRWRPPRPVVGWAGVRRATDFGPHSLQPIPTGSSATSVSEDCLTLNIWTPAESRVGSLPVMVWIHGASLADPNHGDEVPYVFGTLDSSEYDERDRELSDTMMKAWVRFAATGDPNGDGLSAWPAHETATSPCLELGTSIRVRAGARQAQLEFLDSLFTERSAR